MSWYLASKPKMLLLVLIVMGLQGFTREISILSPKVCPKVDTGFFEITYDGRSKLPWFVHEHLTQENRFKNVERSGSFSQDKQIYFLHRSKNSDYLRSGYSRGHMAPARDYQFSKDALKSTFTYANACPQDIEMNGQIWARLEAYVRDLLEDFDSLDVYSGPLFLPFEEDGRQYIKYEVLGENDVAVPTYLFKIIFMNTDQRLKYEAYVIPNDRSVRAKHFGDFTTTIEKLEKISGIQFLSSR